MSAQQTDLTSVKVSDDNTLVFTGSLTRHSVAGLWSKRKSWSVGSETKVDLTDVEVIDTAGVAFLLEILKLVGDGKGPLICVGASEQLKQIARVSGVESLLSLS